MISAETVFPPQVAAMDDSQRRAKRSQMALTGAQYLLGGIGVGVSVLAVIGWLFPAWEVTRPIFFLCALISVSVMASTVVGAWMLIKALFNMVD